ncbi:peptidoglycan DD-metalloendopeptidase family protein [Desulfosarcina sp. OttesenSCG-928-G10]|nr:peptidoglycan DD-metalloendopeptidase family protein [Desulfosarcina sp. OttesenSCG-928-G10]
MNRIFTRKHPQPQSHTHPLNTVLKYALLVFLVAGQTLFMQTRSVAAEAGNDVAVIVADRLNLRDGPGRGYPVVASLPRGARVQVVSRNGDWLQVAVGRKTGFLFNQAAYVHILPAGADLSETETPPPATAPAVRNRDLTRELSASRKKMAAIQREEKDVLTALEETEKDLNQTRQNVSRLLSELAGLDAQIKENEAEYRDIEARALLAETWAAKRLAALYKLSWLGRVHLLTSAESMTDFFFRKRAMETILAQDDRMMRQLAQDKADMQALISRQVVQKTEKETKAKSLDDRLADLREQQLRRERLLKTIRNKKSLQKDAIAALEAAARELDQAMAAFETPAPSPPSPQVPSPEPVAQPAPPQPLSPETAGKPFSSLKGLLLMPVNGKVTSFFGRQTHQKFNVVHFQSGITIQAGRGDPIRAVHDGTVLFSSWFKGFGNMIIIDHGDHYYTVYAHLEERFKAKDDAVKAGEVIATLGDTGSLEGAGLHFEIRHHGKPVNPMNWIKKG